MSRYSAHFSNVQTPQTEPIPNKTQVVNNAGGYVFAIDDWTRLDRFLILGAESGTYYTTEKKLTIENAQAVLRCAKADGRRTVARIVEISDAGRAPKNDPAIFALAICAGIGHELPVPPVVTTAPAGVARTKESIVTYNDAQETRAAALAAINKVCRTGTHFFQFVEAVEQFRGHGRAINRALRQWYTEKDPKDVAFQVCKYQQRNGWSHRDILRLCKPKVGEPLNTIFRWVTKGWSDDNPLMASDLPGGDALTMIYAFERAKKATDKKEICKLIRDHNLPRECVPTQFLTEPSVWEALLEKMPLTAMVRNLATMTRVGLLSPMSSAVGKVMAELTNVERIRKSRLHPVALLGALLTYKQGHGERGSNTWTPVTQVVDALDGAFYKAFGNVEPTNKRWMLALDVSGSMGGGVIAGFPGLTPRVGSAAMALVTAAVEPQHMFMGFSTTFIPLSISPRQRLDDVCRSINGLPFAGTDCALPMVYAAQKKIPVDIFVTYTDSETWQGSIHACQALQVYRQKMGIGAKMVVVGMTSSGFSIADPNDAGQLDVVGFDVNTPSIMNEFAK